VNTDVDTRERWRKPEGIRRACACACATSFLCR